MSRYWSRSTQLPVCRNTVAYFKFESSSTASARALLYLASHPTKFCRPGLHRTWKRICRHRVMGFAVLPPKLRLCDHPTRIMIVPVTGRVWVKSLRTQPEDWVTRILGDLETTWIHDSESSYIPYHCPRAGLSSDWGRPAWGPPWLRHWEPSAAAGEPRPARADPGPAFRSDHVTGPSHGSEPNWKWLKRKIARSRIWYTKDIVRSIVYS